MTKSRWFLVAFAVLLVLVTFSGWRDAQGADKLKIASGIKLSPVYYLPILAGQEQGIWNLEGLEVEWVPFRGSDLYYHAFASDSVDMGMALSLAEWRAASRGVPIVIVSNLMSDDGFFIWVATDSRLRKPADLIGARLGVSSLVGPEFAYGKLVAKVLGLEKQVNFISTGGISESLATLKVKSVDGVVLTIHQMVNLKLGGAVREYLPVADYRPSPWAAYVVDAHKNLVRDKPEVVRRAVRGYLKTTDFIGKNSGWATAKMKEMQGHTPQAAEMVFNTLNFSKDGRIEPKALENVRSFVIDYGFVTAAEALPIDKIYRPDFVR